MLFMMSSVVLLSCDAPLGQVPDAQVSAEESEQTAEVLAATLGDRTAGWSMDLYDMVGTLREDTLVHEMASRAARVSHNPNSTWRGAVSNYELTYDESDHTHHVSYLREGIETSLSTSLEASNMYVYEDGAGERLQMPALSNVYSITFAAEQQGESTVEASSSDVLEAHTFNRKAEWHLLQEADPMELQGAQRQEGILVDGSERRLNYDVTFETVDVTINRVDRHVGSADLPLYALTSGILRFQMDLTLEETGSPTRITGRIILEPEQPATIKIEGSERNFSVDLDSGTTLPHS